MSPEEQGAPLEIRIEVPGRESRIQFRMNQEDLLSLLVCPACRGKLVPMMDGELTEGLCCEACAVVYPVRENIPVMLPEKAVPRKAWDKGKREAEECAS